MYERCDGTMVVDGEKRCISPKEMHEDREAAQDVKISPTVMSRFSVCSQKVLRIFGPIERKS